MINSYVLFNLKRKDKNYAYEKKSNIFERSFGCLSQVSACFDNIGESIACTNILIYNSKLKSLVALSESERSLVNK